MFEAVIYTIVVLLTNKLLLLLYIYMKYNTMLFILYASVSKNNFNSL